MEDSLGWACFLSVGNSFSEFPVCFSVKLIGPDENGTAFFCGVEEKQICWNSLVLLYFYYHTHFEILRSHFLVAIALENFESLQIHILVSFPSRDIVHCLFAHRDEKHKTERCDIGNQKPNSKERDELGKGNQ